MVRNILIAFCVILFVSCSKDTESKLFGKWQLQKVEASGKLRPYTAWNSSKQTPTIDKRDSKQLILSREGKTYTFRKF